MNILNAFVLFVVLLKCVAASGDDVGVRFKEAVDSGDFEWVKTNWENLEKRSDLFDYVIEKGADATVWFIMHVDHIYRAKQHVLAALFDKGEGILEDVIGGIKYTDDDLTNLTDHRPELAGSPEKFFNVLDKIKELKVQELAVAGGVCSLLEAGKHDLVIDLVHALGKRAFRNNGLKDVAIRVAFRKGAKEGISSIMEEYCEHPAVTSEWYAQVLSETWKGEPNDAFLFLLGQADKRDLDTVNGKYTGRNNFHQYIDDALKIAPSAGSRHSRFVEKTKVLGVLLKVFPPPIEVAFDNKGVPILDGMDPTQVPIAGLSILERVERAKKLREQRQKKEAET